MGRPRKYDPDRALDRAMQLFWARGYHETTLSDLVGSTGVQRYSLYASFGSKDALFHAVLDHYLETVVARLLAGLHRKDAGLGEVRRFLDQVGTMADSGAGAKGCLICNSSVECGDKREVAARVARYQSLLVDGLSVALGNSHRRGELRAGLEPDEGAQFLAGIVVAACVLSRSPTGSDLVGSLLGVALRAVTPVLL